MPNFIRIGWETAEELGGKVTNILLTVTLEKFTQGGGYFTTMATVLKETQP